MAPNQSLDSDFFPVIFFNEWPQHIMYVLSPVNSEIKISYQKRKKYESWLHSRKQQGVASLVRISSQGFIK